MHSVPYGVVTLNGRQLFHGKVQVDYALNGHVIFNRADIPSSIPQIHGRKIFRSLLTLRFDAQRHT